MFLSEDPEGFEVKEIPGKGKGVVATRHFRKGAFLFFYRGESLLEEEYDMRLSGDNPHYLLAVPNAGVFLDGKDQRYGLGRLVNDNHRRPNAVMKLYTSAGEIFAGYSLGL